MLLKSSSYAKKIKKFKIYFVSVFLTFSLQSSKSTIFDKGKKLSLLSFSFLRQPAAASIFSIHKFITGRIGLLRERTGLGTGFVSGVSFVFKLCVFDRLSTGCVGGGAGGTHNAIVQKHV